MTPRPPAPVAVRAALEALYAEMGGSQRFTTWVLVQQYYNEPSDWVAFARDENGFMYYSMSMNPKWVASQASACRRGWKTWIDRGAVQAEV